MKGQVFNFDGQNSSMSPTTQSPKFTTAVLLVIFNRPETTRQVFQTIREIKPPRLYIAADGPRPDVPTDIENCAETRKIAEEVDWDCEVRTLFRDQNLNCGLAPSSAFSWFFGQEPEGIILEDDCVPSQSFFWFCQELLTRYRNDDRVMHIGGNNFLDGWQHDANYSYYFSRNGHVWGWATWARAWKKFDYQIGLYEKVKREGFFDDFFLNPLEKFYRLRKFDKTVAGKGQADWWDYQWDFARFVNSGLAIVPEKNLVQNIGFGSDATHTTNGNSHYTGMRAEEMEMPLRHPPFVSRDIESDRRFFRLFMTDTLLAKLKLKRNGEKLHI